LTIWRRIRAVIWSLFNWKYYFRLIFQSIEIKHVQANDLLCELAKERVSPAFGADGGGGPVAGDDVGLVGQGQQTGVNGIENLIRVAAGEVGAADAAGEKSVAGYDHLERDEVETDGALRVAGGMEDVGGIVFEADHQAVVEALVGRSCFGDGTASDPGSLLVHHGEQGKVAFVEQDGCAGEALELERSADVVDVGVGDEDLLELEAVGV